MHVAFPSIGSHHVAFPSIGNHDDSGLPVITTRIHLDRHHDIYFMTTTMAVIDIIDYSFSLSSLSQIKGSMYSRSSHGLSVVSVAVSFGLEILACTYSRRQCWYGCKHG